MKTWFGSVVALLTEFLGNFPVKSFIEHYPDLIIILEDPSAAEDLQRFVSDLKECPSHADIISKGNASVQEKPTCTWQVYIDAGKCWIWVT